MMSYNSYACRGFPIMSWQRWRVSNLFPSTSTVGDG
uniref:Uncharacterized protein n=1 Tax=Arundo donax TaxID=35708 RepID=A0A0A8XWQ2_ARUDO